MHPRVDLFTTVHKALRAVIYQLSTMLQTTDFSDERSTKACLAALEHFLELLHEHAGHEDRTIFAAMHQFDPEMIDQLEEEHKEIAEAPGRDPAHAAISSRRCA